ncbi:MAG: hypothetical protein M1836_003906 [Candelina mexicana]|nr:MAG: hypothetical protein M1836_003906 [Candelina mexicana]
MTEPLARRITDVQKIVEEYILDTGDSVFKSCRAWQIKVAEDPDCDAIYKRDQEQNKSVSKAEERMYYDQFKETALERDEKVGPVASASSTLHVLDLCMAPGAYAAFIMEHYPSARIDAVTLSTAVGGHEVLVEYGEHTRVDLIEADITAYAADCCIDDRWKDSHLAKNLVSSRLYPGQKYDLVICDGKTEQKHLENYEQVKKLEGVRLKAAQLILGLERMKPGGTLYMLLHNIQNGDTIRLLSQFSRFCEVSVFKPTRWHTSRSSFYLIAKQIQTESEDLQMFVKTCKQAWTDATLENKVTEVTKEEVRILLDLFGTKVIEFGHQIWPVQQKGLEKLFKRHGAGVQARNWQTDRGNHRPSRRKAIMMAKSWRRQQ